MNTQSQSTITVKATIGAPIKKVWDYYTMPDHITYQGDNYSLKTTSPIPSITLYYRLA